MDEAISVLIPVYNRERYIGACLESILAQTWRPAQVIVYDDGSRDRTPEVVRSFSGIRLLTGTENRGVSYARNQLLRACTTRYAAWQDSDDLSNVHRLELQLQALRQSGGAIVFGLGGDYQPSRPDDWKNPPRDASSNLIPCFGGTMFDRARTRGIFFNEKVTLGGEDLLWIKAVEQAAGPRVVIHRQLYYIRRHEDRISRWKVRPENRRKRRLSDEAYWQEYNQAQNQ